MNTLPLLVLFLGLGFLTLGIVLVVTIHRLGDEMAAVVRCFLACNVSEPSIDALLPPLADAHGSGLLRCRSGASAPWVWTPRAGAVIFRGLEITVVRGDPNQFAVEAVNIGGVTFPFQCPFRTALPVRWFVTGHPQMPTSDSIMSSGMDLNVRILCFGEGLLLLTPIVEPMRMGLDGEPLR